MIDKKEIPADIRRFVLTSISSVPHIEALMLLRATAPQPWSAEALARRLYVTREAAMAVLAELAQAGMLRAEQDGAAFRYAASAAELGALVDRLAALYATHLVEVTLLIHSRLDRKAQQFANAFSWRSPR